MGRPFSSTGRKASPTCAAHNYRCKECKGKGYVSGGRVRVMHRMECQIFRNLCLTHPSFGRTLETYRAVTGQY